MDTSASAVLKRTRNRGTQQDIGDFGQSLTAGLLDCEITPRGDYGRADIFSKKLRIRVEVKTRDNRHAIGIGVGQLGRYEDWGNLPIGITDTLYAIVTYRTSSRNRVGGALTPGSGLVSVRGRNARQNFIAGRMDEVYLLDLEVISALRSILPIQQGAYPGENRREEDTIRVGRRDLRKMFRDSKLTSIIKDLGLRPKNWVREKISIESIARIDGRLYESRFDFISILRRSTHSRIIPTVREKTLAL